MKSNDKIVIDSFCSMKNNIHPENRNKTKIRKFSYRILFILIILLFLIAFHKYKHYNSIFKMNESSILMHKDGNVKLYSNFKITPNDITFDFAWLSGVYDAKFNINKYEHNNAVAVDVHKERGLVKVILQPKSEPDKYIVKYLDIGYNRIKIPENRDYNIFIVGSRFSGKITFCKDVY